MSAIVHCCMSGLSVFEMDGVDRGHHVVYSSVSVEDGSVMMYGVIE